MAGFAACGLPMTLVGAVCSRSCSPFLLLPVQAALAMASKLHVAKQARLFLTATAYLARWLWAGLSAASLTTACCYAMCLTASLASAVASLRFHDWLLMPVVMFMTSLDLPRC